MRNKNSDYNSEAVKIANALKPMFKTWFDEWARSCVRVKKMTVSTAPSNGIIGVKDAFSNTELLIPCESACASAVAGDTVWCEWYFDNMQTLHAYCMGNVESSSTSFDNLTVTGNFDVTNRRCHARLNSAGWYRAIKIASEGRGGVGFVVDINITRSYSNASNEVHKIHLLGCWNNFVFVDEASRSNALRVSKIRYTRDASYNGYVDIYFNSSNFENVSVDFVPHTQSDYMYEITAESLQAVADAPSGETVLTTYNLTADTDRTLTVSNSNCTARFYAIGGVKAVRISDPKGLTAKAVTTLVSASEMADYMPVGSYVQDCVSMNSAMERVRFYVDSSGIRAYNYSSNTGTLNMELTITYV